MHASPSGTNFMRPIILRMIDKKIIEKIHEELEGQLTPEERTRLHEHLAVDPEAVTYYHDWQTIQKTIERNRETAPEVDLAQDIIRRVASSQKRKSPTERLVIAPSWKRQYSYYSLIFVSGMLFGFLAFFFLMPDGGSDFLSDGQATGTMYDSRSFDQMKVADNLLVELTGIRASIDVRYSTGIVEARINITSNEELSCLLSFNPDELQPINVTSAEPTGGSDFSASYNMVRITCEGQNQYLVRLVNKNSLPHQIGIRLVRNEMTLYQNSVTINNK